MEINIKDLLYGREAAIIFIKQTNFNDNENEARLQSLCLKLKNLRYKLYFVVLHHKVGYLAINKNIPYSSKDKMEVVISDKFFETIDEITDEITETETYLLERFDDLTIFDSGNDLYYLHIVYKCPEACNIMGLWMLSLVSKEHWSKQMIDNIEIKKKMLREKLLNFLVNFYNKKG